MYLKKLEMLGFKSFADRTDFSFQPGVTCVVGPNGCGKSNVVDAFKWIFGEQSAKGLRGSEMRDVIFNGTVSRKPAGFAEVTVVFDNQDRYLDIDYAEVAVTRRLFRSGESEYLINKQKCRLKDIKELFLDTGIGQTSYSILEQGKIDVLLQSSALDRRVIFEEAAGISRYRIKKAETVRALLRVEDNLSRLQDIIDEVEKRIRRVKAQASKARRYQEHSDRLKELRIRTALEEYEGSVSQRAALSFGLWWTNHRVGRHEDVERRLAAGLEAHQEAGQGLRDELREVREEISSRRSHRERIEERTENARRRLRELAEEKVAKAEDLEQTTEGLERIRARIREESERREALVEDIEGRRDALEALRRRLEETQARHREREERLGERKRQLVELLHERSRVANAITQLSSEVEALQARAERLESSAAGFRHQREECIRQEQEFRSELEAVARNEALVDEKRQELSRVVADEEEAVAALEARLGDHQAELHRTSSRLEVLQSFEESLDGVASGVAEVLRRRDELPPGLVCHGLLGSLLRVDRPHAAAVEAVLGDLAQSIVVGSQQGAIDLLSFASEEDLGSVRVISLDRVDAGDAGRFPRQGGVLGPLRDFVDGDGLLKDLLDRLLANVVLVEDFATAVALSRNGLQPFRLVTRAGELVEPWGAFSVAGEAESGLISRRSEMEELRERLSEVEGRCEECRGEIAARREAVEVHREALRGEESARDELRRRAVEVRGEIAQRERESERLRREIDLSASELTEVREGLRERQVERSRREEEARQLAETEARGEEEAQELEGAIETSRAEVESAAEDVSRGRLELLETEKQEEALRGLIEQRGVTLEEKERHEEDLGRALRSVEERTSQTEEELRSSRGEIEQVEGELEELESRRAGLDEREGAHLELEKAFRREIDRVRAAVARVVREREELQLRDQEERYRRNSVLERIDEQYGLDLRALVARREAGSGGEGDGQGEGDEPGRSEGDIAELERFLTPLEDWDRDAARREIKELQGKIRRLGNVNLEALDELEELEERYRFQLTQRNDLVESEAKLRQIIDEINRKSREMFLETFGKVQEQFGELFRKCFGGGRAELVLEEGADVLDAGIEIVARPPGKKLTSLSLMSGGEKTMTTIALLLAIFRSRPSPFCVLDEVDAPLDDSNVQRFVVLLQDFIEQSQFIIITHNKVTMGTGSVLYGVTMQERGVSRRVSVELETYDEAAMAAEAASPAEATASPAETS